MRERNPNHPVTRAIHDEWYKLCALALFKSGLTECEITVEDIEDFNASGLGNIVVDSRENRLILRLVGDREAERLAQEEGGLPI